MSSVLFMKQFFTNTFNKIESGSKVVGDFIEQKIATDIHKIAITGLSRSGKSMLFTSLIIQLNERAQVKSGGSYTLPLLKSLPMDSIVSFDILPILGEALFPISDCIDALENQKWPTATDQIYGFELKVTSKQPARLKKLLGRSHQITRFRFYDYPGEWLTDLPMLDLTFEQWCHKVTAQQTTEPQKTLAAEWLKFLETYNFDLQPTEALVKELVLRYRDYLVQAKAAGISMLQPGGYLLDKTPYNWQKHGFVPLPAKITCDLKHPWMKIMSANYSAYQVTWLEQLKQKYFSDFDSQVILVDLFEGLRHSRQHLMQLKESLSNLAGTFINGQTWFQKMLGKSVMTKVAFVATKVDLVPSAQNQNLLSLLKDVSSGARSKFEEQDITFNHFLLSSIRVTKEDDKYPGKVIYLNKNNEPRFFAVEPLPAKMSELQQGEKYITPNPVPSKEFKQQILASQNIDRLLEYMMSGLKDDR
ncbi:YcjX family protein [Thiomicrorhabdus hydrogeniphila]